VESNGTGGSLLLILGIVQFFISVIATVLFAIVPSGHMFGDHVRGKSRKYLASQTFTASYPPLDKKTRMVSILATTPTIEGGILRPNSIWTMPSGRPKTQG